VSAMRIDRLENSGERDDRRLDLKIAVGLVAEDAVAPKKLTST
jgi:hypothetical protein